MVNKIRQVWSRVLCIVQETSRVRKSSYFHGDNIFNTPMRNIPLESREKLTRLVESAAEGLCLEGNSNISQVPGVGLCKLLYLSDGTKITTVYPAVKYRKVPLPMANISLKEHLKCNETDMVEDFEFIDNPFQKARKRHQKANKLYHTFIRGIPNITKECIRSSEYYFENGLRKVRPYFMVHDDYLHDLKKPIPLGEYYKYLLGDNYEEYHNLRIKLGLISINLENVTSTEQMVQQGDYISSLVHYHERPVLDEKIEIIYEDDDMLVVNKPASIVVYPISGYRLNSLTFILAKEMGYMNIRPVHRLDRLTSGVIIFAKKIKVAGQLQKEFRDNHPKKEYLALVEGKFPDTHAVTGLIYNNPIESYKINSSRSESYNEARECETVFHKIKEYKINDANNSSYSLVRCVPLQGRTHQIRIHLMKMGYPIVNDYLYNNRDLLARYSPDPKDIELAVNTISTKYKCNDHSNTLTVLSDRQETTNASSAWMEDLSSQFGTNVPFCLECTLGGYVGQRLAADSDPMFMCLHSWKYEIDSINKCFEAQAPRWATDTSYANQILCEREKRITSVSGITCHPKATPT